MRIKQRVFKKLMCADPISLFSIENVCAEYHYAKIKEEKLLFKFLPKELLVNRIRSALNSTYKYNFHVREIKRHIRKFNTHEIERGPCGYICVLLQ